MSKTASPTQSRPANRGAQARHDLVAAALSAFAARGFPGVSIADLASELGVAKATVLHHFHTKERLYDAVLALVASDLEQLLDALGDRLDPGPKGLAAVACAYLDWARDFPDHARLLARELLDNRDRADRAGRWHLREFTNRLRALVEEGQRQGALRHGDPALPIEMILGFVQFHVAAGPTRTRLMGSENTQAYERWVDAQWAEAMSAAFKA